MVEATRSRPAPALPARRTPLRPKLLAMSVAACFGLGPVAALANPSGATVVSGSASFASSGAQLTVTNSPNAIINWQSFSIGVNEITRFIQQNSASAVLNRVVGSGGVVPQSVIDGILSSNGRVFLMNNSGVVFGPNARIDVAGLIASSLNMSNEDFLAGRMRFTEVLGAGGVSNAGLIETANGGRVFLVAPDVKNSGIIRAPQGEIVLAAGKSVELVTEGSPYVTVKVTNSDTEQALNMGSLVSQGGRISMGAALVRNTGVVEAGGAVVGDGGVIRLVGSKGVTLDAGSRLSATGGSGGGNGGSITVQAETGTTLVYGVVDATAAAGKGGTVKALGVRVGVVGNGVIDASGDTGGGTVLVGGDYQGRNADVQNAQRTLIGANGVIRADAGTAGDGGRVIVWADGDTRMAGTISARGGSQSGNGGFIETSGKIGLDVNGARIDTRAPNGNWGNWLLDPMNVLIDAGGIYSTLDVDQFSDYGGVGLTIDPFTIASAFSTSGAVTIQATNDITLATNLTLSYSGGPTTGLTMQAGNNIDLGANTIFTNGRHVSLTANDNAYGTATGTGAILGTGSIDTSGGPGGNITLSGHGITVASLRSEGISYGGGNISLTADSLGVQVLGNIQTKGGSVSSYVSGGGSATFQNIETKATSGSGLPNGNISITSSGGNVTTKDLITKSEPSAFGAGNVLVDASAGSATVNGVIDAAGYGSSGASGNVSVYGQNVQIDQLVSTISGGGGGGGVTITASQGVQLGGTGFVGGVKAYGGTVTINAGTGITVGASGWLSDIDSSSGASGQNAGTITLQTGSGAIGVQGALRANGFDGTNGGAFAGSNGGQIQLIRTSTTAPGAGDAIKVTGAIQAWGGNGAVSIGNVGGSGGQGAFVNVFDGSTGTVAGNVSLLGGVDSHGGNGASSTALAVGGAGNAGGNVRVNATGAVQLGAINMRGGNGATGGAANAGSPGAAGGNGGDAGRVQVFGSSIAFLGAVDGAAGNGGTGGAGNASYGGGVGGSGGTVLSGGSVLGTTGSLSFGGSFTSTGGNGGSAGAFNGNGSLSTGNGGNAGNGGAIQLSGSPSAITFASGMTINTSGGAGGAASTGGSPMAGGTGGNAGNIQLTANGNNGNASISITANGGVGGNAPTNSGQGGNAGTVTLAGFSTVGSVSAVGGQAGTGGTGAIGGTGGTITIDNLAGTVTSGALSSYAGRNANNTYGTSGLVNISSDGAINQTGVVITRDLQVKTNATTAGLAGNVTIANTANQIDSTNIRGYASLSAPITGTINYASKGFALTPTGVFRATGDINISNPNAGAGFIMNGEYLGGFLSGGSGISAGGAINVVTDSLSFTGFMITAGTVVQWYPLTNSLQMQVYNSSLSQFSAPMVKFGNVANTGGLVLMDSIAPASVQTLSLINGGQIFTNGTGVTVSVTNLNADGSQVTLNGTNNVVQLQGQARAGNFTFSNSGNIVLGIADPGNGITGVGATGNVILSSVSGSIVSTATGVDTIKGGTGVQLDALNGTLGTAAAPLSIATPAFTAFSKGGMYATLNQYAPQFVQAQSIQNTTAGDIALKLYGGGQFNSLVTNGGPGNVDILTLSPLNILAGASSGGNMALTTSGTTNNGMTLDGPFTVGSTGTFSVTVGTGGALTKGANFTGTITSLVLPASTSTTSTTAALQSPTVSQVIATTTSKEVVQTAGIASATQKTDSEDEKSQKNSQKKQQGKGSC